MPKSVAEKDLARFIDRETVEFVRFYPHPIERVWRAITDPKEISVWFWTAKFDLRVGSSYAFGPVESDMNGVLVAIEPPRLIRFSGPSPTKNPQGYFQFELESVAGGTKMVFVQHFTPGTVLRPEWPADPADHPAVPMNPWRAGTLAGWHLAFEAMEHLMSGEGGESPSLEESALLPVYRDHMLATQP